MVGPWGFESLLTNNCCWVSISLSSSGVKKLPWPLLDESFEVGCSPIPAVIMFLFMKKLECFWLLDFM